MTSRVFDLDAFFADSFPVILSDSTTLEEGDNKQMDVQALSNFFDTPMVIDEVRTQIISPNVELQVGNFGGSIRLKLAAGRFALNSVYVPVGCLGPTYDGGTMDSATYAAGLFSPESLLSGFTDPYHMGFFRWKLPRPLVIPPGTALDAKISRQIEGLNIVYPSTTTVSVNVAYVGRVSKKALPSGIAVPIPYVGLFENVFTSANVAISDQLDLYNPFVQPLNVQRLIGRWQNIYLDSGDPSSSLISLDANGTSGGSVIEFPPTQIMLFNGFAITDGFRPGGSIFEYNTRSLVANIELSRGQGFEVTIDATSGVPSTGAQPTPTGSNTSFVTMIGWRMESL